MLKPREIERLPTRMVELYSQAEIDALEYMARRIAAFDDFIPAAQWQYQRLIEMGNYHSYIVKALAAMTNKTEDEIRSIMERSGLKSLRFDSNVYKESGLDPPPLAASQALQAVMRAGRTLWDYLKTSPGPRPTHPRSSLSKRWTGRGCR